MATKTKSVPCGDWHLGWGFCGNDHIGKLEKTGENSYKWTGRRQGRHGQIIRSRYSVEFSTSRDEFGQIFLNDPQPHSLPAMTEVFKAIYLLEDNQ